MKKNFFFFIFFFLKISFVSAENNITYIDLNFILNNSIVGKSLKEHILKFSSFVAMLQIRYTSKNANIKVIDRTLDEATLGGKEIQMKMPPNTSVLPSESNPLSVDVSNLRNKIGYSIKELDKKEIEDIKKEDKENGNR